MRIEKRFTLIEMIAVVAIAGALIAMLVPAFTSMMEGSKVDHAASNLKLGLDMAQAKAVAARKYVAVVMPRYYGHLTADDGGYKLRPYCDGGYRLAFVRKSGSDWYFSGWVPGSNWSNPDDGARIVAISNGDAFKDLKIETGANEDDDWKALTHADNRKALVFSPYGGLMSDNGINIVFTETKFTGDTTADNQAEYEKPNEDNSMTLQINSVTGKVKYLTTL